MPSECPPLPVELILQILENVADAESSRAHGASRFPNLLACAAVSKTWAPISQSLIFRNVILETLVQALAFMLAVQGNDEKAAFLRRSVTSMEIIVNDEESGQVITQMILAHILRLCPKLESVKIFYYCLRPLDAATINVLKNVAPPSALSLHCAQDPSPLWDLLELWPNTQHLKVVTWETLTDAITKPPCRTWAPLELRWADDSDSSEAKISCLTPSPGSLRILHLAKPPSDAFFRDLIETHGPFLRSLRLSTIDDQVADSIAYCQNLEEFKYGDMPSLSLLQALPIGLEHLQFQGNRCNDSVGIGYVIKFIEERGAALKVVTYNLCGSPKEEDFIRLEVICKKRQINLRCYADSAPMEEQEPLTSPVHFPRPTPHRHSRKALPLAAIRCASQVRLPSQLSRAPSSLHVIPTLPLARTDDDYLAPSFLPTKDREMEHITVF